MISRTNQVLIASAALVPAGLSSGAVAMGNFSRAGIQVVWSELASETTIAADIKIEVSNDGVNWCSVMTDVEITTADGNTAIGLDDILFAFLRVTITPTDTTGTAKATISLKE
jgi:hypothetical protein